jgi:hemoglobin
MTDNDTASAAAQTVTEADMERLVRRFYDLCHADPVLGPFFAQTVADFETHVQVVIDFWSSALLKTGKYRGNQFMAHAKHPIEPEHFDIWLTLFEQAATETLPPAMAAEAMIKARQMGRSIKAGMFTVPAHKFGGVKP